MTASGEIVKHVSKRHLGRRWGMILLVCLAIAVFAVGYSGQHGRVEVRVTNPTFQDIQSSVSAQGVVLPSNDFQARANFSGLVEGIYVKVGEKVRAGQLLIRMKDQYAESRLISARAALEAAEVNNENVLNNGSKDDRIGFAVDLAHAQGEQAAATKSLATVKELAARGSASESEVLAAEQRLKGADASVHALQQRMEARYSPTDVGSWQTRVDADKSALAAEQVSYDNANIKSPIAGTAYVIPVSRYDFVPMGAELLHVADLSKIFVRANFFEQDVGALKVGQQVIVNWDGNQNRSWHGHMTSSPLALTRVGDSNVGQSTIAIDDAQSDLPVNTNVTVIVKVAIHPHALTVPREAIRRDNSSQFVYRIEDGKLVRTPVDVGLIDPLRAEIIKGLGVRDTIALYAVDHQALTDRLPVKVAE